MNTAGRLGLPVPPTFPSLWRVCHGDVYPPAKDPPLRQSEPLAGPSRLTEGGLARAALVLLVFELGLRQSMGGAGSPALGPAFAWQQHAGYRIAETVPDPQGKTGFSLLNAAMTGLLFTNHLPDERHLTNQIYLDGSGVAAGDYDGDRWCDLFFSGLEGRSALYRNLRLSIKSVDGQPRVVAVNGRPLTQPDLTNRFSFRYQPQAGGGASVFHDELGEADAVHLNQGGGRFASLEFFNAFVDERGVPLAQPPFDWMWISTATRTCSS